MRRRLFDHSVSMSDVSLFVGCIFFVCSLVAVLSWCFVFLPYYWSTINSTLVIACDLAREGDFERASNSLFDQRTVPRCECVIVRVEIGK